MDFDFSILGKMLKLRVEPNVVTFNTLMNGLCVEGKFAESIRLFEKMVCDGYELNLITYNIIVNGLCQIERTGDAVRLLRKMEMSG